ncbi:substrate-binding domain-containing protein, partial [Streptomyces anthocyanicus]
MHKTPARRASVLVAAVSSLSLLTAGCGDGDGPVDDDTATNAKNAEASPNAPTKTGLTVGFLPKQVNTPYFAVADRGGERAVESLGSTFKEVGTDQGADASGQVSHINGLTEQKADAIAVSALDPDALCDLTDGVDGAVVDGQRAGGRGHTNSLWFWFRFWS